jgi:hypothetical protein
MLRAGCFATAIESGKNLAIATKNGIQMIIQKILHGCAYVKQANASFTA